eukprot:2372663-Amphidinium_carterae.1
MSTLVLYLSICCEPLAYKESLRRGMQQVSTLHVVVVTLKFGAVQSLPAYAPGFRRFVLQLLGSGGCADTTRETWKVKK